MNLARFHWPPRTCWSAWGMLRARDMSMATVCSAAATTLPVGAFTTMTPAWVAASMSMLSTPTPARPMTRNFLPAAITSAVTWVALRTRSAS